MVIVTILYRSNLFLKKVAPRRSKLKGGAPPPGLEKVQSTLKKSVPKDGNSSPTGSETVNHVARSDGHVANVEGHVPHVHIQCLPNTTVECCQSFKIPLIT